MLNLVYSFFAGHANAFFICALAIFAQHDIQT